MSLNRGALTNAPLSSLAVRETLLGVLQSRDIEGKGVIHSSDFRSCCTDLGFPMGSPTVQDVLIFCTINEDGFIDFSRLKEELRMERHLYNTKPKQDKAPPQTSTATNTDVPWRAELNHKNKIEAEKQAKLIRTHRKEVYDCFQKYSQGLWTVEQVFDIIQGLGIVVTLAFQTLMRTMSLAEIGFHDFNRALIIYDVNETSSTDNRERAAGAPRWDQTDRAQNVREVDHGLFIQRKRINPARSAQTQGNSDLTEAPKPTRKPVMEIDETGEMRTKFRTSEQTRQCIFGPKKDAVMDLQSHNLANMQYGILGEDVPLKYNSELKLVREQIIATLRKVDSGAIDFAEFQEKIYQMGYDLPSSMINALKKSFVAGKVDWVKCIQQLDVDMFKVKALEERTPEEVISGAKEKLLKSILNRGADAMSCLERAFRLMDEDDSKELSLSEFRLGCRKFGLAAKEVSDDDLRILFNAFDSNGNGSLSYDEFLVGLRGNMSPQRKKWVRHAFDKLDRKGIKSINLDDMVEVYDPSYHPDVSKGEKSAREVVTLLINAFDIDQDGQVSYEEFENYYTNLSFAIDSDEEFIQMVKKMWGLGEKAPPPPTIRQAFGPDAETRRPIAKQTHGDIIHWNQEPSEMELKDEVKYQKKALVQGPHSISRVAILWNKIPRNKFNSQAAVDEEKLLMEEWKVDVKCSRRPGPQKNKTTASTLMNWSAAQKKGEAAAAAAAAASAAASVVGSPPTSPSSSSSKWDPNVMPKPQRKMGGDTAYFMRGHGLIPPYDSDYDPSIAKPPKAQGNPRPLSEHFQESVSIEEKSSDAGSYLPPPPPQTGGSSKIKSLADFV